MISRLSLHARLLLVAVITSIIALAFASFAISRVLERVVRHNLDEKLAAEIAILDRAIGNDGRLNPAQIINLPGFGVPKSGWSWQVEGANGQWTSGSTVAAVQMRGRQWRRPSPWGLQRGRGALSDGTEVFVRENQIERGGTIIRISASGPRNLVDRPLRAALIPLLFSLGLLGAALAAAALVQLRLGLKPVRQLRDAVARVRAGKAAKLPEDQPKELQPLADEVNALIDQNVAGLAHARGHVANLAHGLKTPLATLALRLEREGASEGSRALVSQLDARIAHHLRRARSAAAGSSGRSQTDLGTVVADLTGAMEHIHSERKVAIERRIGDPVDIIIDREDLEEMLGNLLDNACRHARGQVALSSSSEGQMALVIIEDDGPGIAEAEVANAIHPGTRLDESGKGYGFGLSIVRELAELNGGSLALGRSERLGGLQATLILPRRA